MSSPYTFKPGGSLKLKGDKSQYVVHADASKKKKSSTSSGASSSKVARDAGAAPSPPPASMPGTTKAERKFEEVQRKRVRLRLLTMQLRDQARKEAHKSHKDKVDAFNAYLDSISEHHDMPKIGPG